MDGMKVFVWVRMVGTVALAVAVLWGVQTLLARLQPVGAPSAPARDVGPKEAVAPRADHALPAAPVPAAAGQASVPPTVKEKEQIVTKAAPLPVGAAFVAAVIKPLDDELNKRFWGWRPNDLVNLTDNVNNRQRGVLEVTRRTVRILTERISRTGTTVAYNRQLEQAMSWLMVKADAYWFPSPEAKYNDAIDAVRAYRDALFAGKEFFFTRADNLIPLLREYEDLLGSCEENLVKTREKDGSAVSFFAADDYFFYAKGVAAAMQTVLEAVLEDFGPTIDSRRGLEVLHQAIGSCRHACEIAPWIILDSAPGSVFANHRANMAAPISHAQFYLGVLITALST